MATGLPSRPTVTTLSKIGLVLIAGGLSIVAGTGAAWLGWLAFGVGLVLAFGPDLVGLVAPRLHRRRELAERVPGWEWSFGREEGVGLLVLRLTPPSTEEVDPSVTCDVRLPDGEKKTPSRAIVMPQMLSTSGTWNPYYFVVFPDGFQDVGAPLPPGEYIVTWSRSSEFGRQTLRRLAFTIDHHGALTLPKIRLGD